MGTIERDKKILEKLDEQNNKLDYTIEKMGLKTIDNALFTILISVSILFFTIYGILKPEINTLFGFIFIIYWIFLIVFLILYLMEMFNTKGDDFRSTCINVLIVLLAVLTSTFSIFAVWIIENIECVLSQIASVIILLSILLALIISSVIENRLRKKFKIHAKISDTNKKMRKRKEKRK